MREQRHYPAEPDEPDRAEQSPTRTIDYRPVADPSTNQDDTAIGRYYGHVVEGDVAVIKNTEGHWLQFKVTKISGVAASLNRVYTEHAGTKGGRAWHRHGGRNCMHPRGRTSLVVPTREVLAFAETHPRGAPLL